MSNEQFYYLVESWTSEEWPLPLDVETIKDLNGVAPPGHHYALSPHSDFEDRVELYHYHGEFNPFELGDKPRGDE